MIEWTPERCEQLRALWLDGHSCSIIAGMIGGVTRNAIIGKVHRMKLPGRKQTSALYRMRPGRPRKVWAPKPPKIKRKERTKVIRPPVLKAEPFAFSAEAWEPLGPAISLLSLSDTVCRWPVGGTNTEPGTGFCGCSVKRGKVYCPEHYARSVGKGTPSEREAVRIAMSAVSTDNFQRVLVAA
jgi:GcrA cell cycle regulator